VAVIFSLAGKGVHRCSWVRNFGVDDASGLKWEKDSGYKVFWLRSEEEDEEGTAMIEW
jgi:hypothetical protein